jgi:DeoR family fructose operon transcriptional repressor
MNITIYTNNIYFINLLGLEGGSSKVFIIPGNLYTKTLSIIGSKAINEINSIKFDKCFIGINSKINNEYFTSNQEESLIKEVAIKNSKVVYMVFDKSKINVQGLKYKIKINKKVNEVVS